VALKVAVSCVAVVEYMLEKNLYCSLTNMVGPLCVSPPFAVTYITGDNDV